MLPRRANCQNAPRDAARCRAMRTFATRTLDTTLTPWKVEVIMVIGLGKRVR
jgi:hypothetical protein